MRYTDERLLDALAREYVLGTLHGRARARFDRILGESLDARRAVMDWERRLGPLARAAAPVSPPPDTWSRIEKAVESAKKRAVPTRVPIESTVHWWQAAAAVFALASMVLGTLYVIRGPIEAASYVAIVNDDQATPLWLVQAYSDAGELVVDAVDDRPAPEGSSYELWTLPDDGSGPVSLGVISGVGQTRVALSDEVLLILGQSSIVAVSLEPAGGSPTGAPTGPVLYTANIVQS